MFYERGCQGKKFSLDWEVGVFGPDIQPLVAPATNFVDGPWDLGWSCARVRPRGRGQDVEFIVDSSQRPRAAAAGQAETGLGWPTMVLSETGRLQLSGVIRGGLRVG